MHIFNVSPLAVLIVAVIQWLLGAIWYGFVFKARWKALVGIPEGSSSNAWFPMVAAFVANIVLAFVLAIVVGQNILAPTNFPGGVYAGALVWVGFMAPPLFTQHIFEKRPAKLFAINAAYWLLAMMLGGGVMANLHI
jgi:hypothetical protein